MGVGCRYRAPWAALGVTRKNISHPPCAPLGCRVYLYQSGTDEPAERDERDDEMNTELNENMTAAVKKLSNALRGEGYTEAADLAESRDISGAIAAIKAENARRGVRRIKDAALAVRVASTALNGISMYLMDRQVGIHAKRPQSAIDTELYILDGLNRI